MKLIITENQVKYLIKKIHKKSDKIDNEENDSKSFNFFVNKTLNFINKLLFDPNLTISDKYINDLSINSDDFIRLLFHVGILKKDDKRIIVDKSNLRDKLKDLYNIMLSPALATENTTTASSGAYVGPMIITPIKRDFNLFSPLFEDVDIELLDESLLYEISSTILPKNEKKEDVSYLLDSLKYKCFALPKFGSYCINKAYKVINGDKTIFEIPLMSDDDNSEKIELLYTKTGDNKGDLFVYFVDYGIIKDAFLLFPKEFRVLLLKEIIERLEEGNKLIDENTDTSSVGYYATPGFLGSDFFGNKNGKGIVNKGITHKKPFFAGGKFVKFDDCVRPNNNKEAQNGGCSQGAADKVVKLVDKL
jgi:hypothetical protein